MREKLQQDLTDLFGPGDYVEQWRYCVLHDNGWTYKSSSRGNRAEAIEGAARTWGRERPWTLESRWIIDWKDGSRYTSAWTPEDDGVSAMLREMREEDSRR